MAPSEADLALDIVRRYLVKGEQKSAKRVAEKLVLKYPAVKGQLEALMSQFEKADRGTQAPVDSTSEVPKIIVPSWVERGISGVPILGFVLAPLTWFFGDSSAILAVLAPLGSMSCLLWTMFTCYYLWRSGPNLRDARIIFPAISELGASMPEQRIYQIGFATVGIFLIIHISLFKDVVLPQILAYGDSEQQKHADTAVWYGYLSAVGVILQGVFTLEMQVSMQSMIHWGAAVCFMMGAMHHAQASKVLYAEAMTHSNHIPVLQNSILVKVVGLRAFIIDYSSMVMFAVPLLSQVLFASSSGNDSTDAAGGNQNQNQEQGQGAQPDVNPKMMNSMGLMQWLIVFQFAVYFASYAVDLWVCVKEGEK